MSAVITSLPKYCPSLTQYHRRETLSVNIGDIPLGNQFPIRIQSMTTADTLDTQKTVEESIRLITAGSDYVRITAPSIKEAQNLQVIKKKLKEKGFNTPLIADIHFTPNAAELAARIVEKVRINPGNYSDKKKFELTHYTGSEYEEALEKIRKRFTPLVKICKEYGTAMRIGTNHGSLSDRIMSQYGDTPLGMVESALEFIRICEDLNYYNLVISMKASNPQIMIQAYRLLVQKLEEEQLQPYPLHLGVTEAGDGEDGRIKSALGIGTLLEDGLGDTIRVSLTEDPVKEIPVAKKIAERYVLKTVFTIPPLSVEEEKLYQPYQYEKRLSGAVYNIGFKNVPRIVADFSHLKLNNKEALKAIGHHYIPLSDKWIMDETGADFIFLGSQNIPFMMPNGLKVIQNADVWEADTKHAYPLFSWKGFLSAKVKSNTINFVELPASQIDLIEIKLTNEMLHQKNVVLVVTSDDHYPFFAYRKLFLQLTLKGINNPVILKHNYDHVDMEHALLYAASDFGGILSDGFGDGLWLSSEIADFERLKAQNGWAFGILQAARARITKTEYISCPSCGRTLFDLEETTAMIRKRTDHLKGIKIGIMGCIVNGPGEMADADYGYVGSGKGKITLYRGQEVVKKNIASESAVDELIKLIKGDGNWIENNV